jgi:hypothetical protein
VFLVMFVYAEEVFLVATGSNFSVLLRWQDQPGDPRGQER